MSFALPCVIFAGGKSSRMGRDKALLPFGGYDTLAEYQYRRLVPLFSSVLIATKTPKFPFDAPLVFDAEEIYAPTAGLMAAFGALESDFFALSVDTPFVDEATMKRLMEAYERKEADAVIARSPSGAHPMCGIYTHGVLPELAKMAASGERRLNRLLQKVNTRFVDFDEDAPFTNLNTPADYEKARSL